MATRKDCTRSYVNRESDDRVNRYAERNHISKIEAFDKIILATLDVQGNVRDKMILTEAQQKIIAEIAQERGQPPEKATQDLINYALLIYGSDVSLREMFIFSAPAMMDSLVRTHPDIAKEILNDIKKPGSLI